MRVWLLSSVLTLGLCVLMQPAMAGVEGTYTLDKKALGQKMQARLAKVPAKRKAFAKMAQRMFASMKMKITLNPNGTANTHSEMKVFGSSKIQKGKGKWSQKGSLVLIQTTVVTRKKKTFKRTIQCQIKSTQLHCVNPKQKQTGALPFVKVGSTPAKRAAAPAKRAAAPAKRAAAPAKRAAAPAKRAAAPAKRPVPRR